MVRSISLIKHPVSGMDATRIMRQTDEVDILGLTLPFLCSNYVNRKGIFWSTFTFTLSITAHDHYVLPA